MTGVSAWLYIKGTKSVRIVIDGGAVAVHGPGPNFNRSLFPDEMDAALHHAALEEALVRDGWTLERLTTERRSGNERRVSRRGTDRRHPLRLVK